MKNTGFYYVKEVAKEKSFSKASKKLGISQPALSSYINKLEKKWGILLFDRSISPIELTEFGKSYLEYSGSVIEAKERFEKEISDLNELKTGTIVLGSTACFSLSYLPYALTEYSKKYPGINFQIIEGKTPDIQRKCLEGTVDIFLSDSDIDDSLFEKEDIFEERIVIAVPRENVINEKLKDYQVSPETIIAGKLNDEAIKEVDMSEFKDERFILLNEDQRVRKIVNKLFDEYSISPEEIMEIQQSTTGFAMAVAGMGVTFVAESAIKFNNYANHPIYYKVGTKESTSRKMCVAFKKGKYISKAGRLFINEMKTIFE